MPRGWRTLGTAGRGGDPKAADLDALVADRLARRVSRRSPRVVGVCDRAKVPDLLDPVEGVAASGGLAGVGSGNEVVGGVNVHLLVGLVDDVRQWGREVGSGAEPLEGLQDVTLPFLVRVQVGVALGVADGVAEGAAVDLAEVAREVARLQAEVRALAGELSHCRKQLRVELSLELPDPPPPPPIQILSRLPRTRSNAFGLHSGQPSGTRPSRKLSSVCYSRRIWRVSLLPVLACNRIMLPRRS